MEIAKLKNIFNNALEVDVILKDDTVKKLKGIVVDEKLMVLLDLIHDGLMTEYYTIEKIETDEEKNKKQEKKDELLNSLKTMWNKENKNNDIEKENANDNIQNIMENLENKMDSLVNNIIDIQFNTLFSKKIKKTIFERILDGEVVKIDMDRYMLVKYQIFSKYNDKNDYFQNRQELGIVKNVRGMENVQN